MQKVANHLHTSLTISIKISIMKECTKCNEVKELTKFSKHKSRKDGLQSLCKQCDTNRHRTKEGLISKIYGQQKRSSKERGYEMPNYTNLELQEWLFSKDKFHYLYINWEDSGWNKDFIPSVDRPDDYKPYSLDNIQLMTWKENRDKGALDRKEGRNNKSNVSVLQYTLDGVFVKEYYSQTQASIQTNVNRGNIGSCCIGICETAGGFKWTVKN